MPVPKKYGNLLCAPRLCKGRCVDIYIYIYIYIYIERERERERRKRESVTGKLNERKIV